MNLNKVIVLGNVARDPEVRSMPSGSNVASFGLATNRVWKDKAGQKQQEAEFHNIVLFGKLADIADQYVKKGGLLLVEGRLKTQSWEKDGIKRYRTEIIGEVIQLGPRPGGATQAQEKPENNGEATPEELAAMDQGQTGEIDVASLDL